MSESLLDQNVFEDDSKVTFADQDLERVLQLVVRLDERIKNDEPDISNLLGLIHQDLSNNPELAYMLNEEQVRIVVSGHVKYMNAEIVKSATKKKTTKADMKNVSVDDL